MVKTTIKVNGMMCGMCESHVNDTVRNKLKVKKVSSSHTNGETVIISEEEIPEEQLKDVIKASGYDYISSSSEPYKKKGLFGRG